jgi:ribosome-associated toxin RatA of RatAB toxin-antitoxin module
MTILDQLFVNASPRTCFDVGADVERWPDILPHYRFVRMRSPLVGGRDGVVEMAAWRDFAGPLRYPTWWLSEMRVDETEPAVFYRHIRGVTRGMDVKWSFTPENDGTRDGTRIRITHAWDGPAWPLIGGFAWRNVIAPHFVSFIATRTLAGVAAEAERRQRIAANR